MSSSALNLLLTRRSVVANNMCEPGPDTEQLKQILTVGARAPDHKKLCPWRFILFEGEARTAFGSVLADACKQAEPDAGERRLDTEAARFQRAPVVIAVISHIVDHPAVPELEQVLSAGAVCQNILHGATALGFASQWITEWYAFNDAIREALSLQQNEHVAGYIYIGSAREAPSERGRPDLDTIVTRWQSK